jgi:hypothetical protein
MPSFFMPVFIIVIFFAFAAAGLVVPGIVLAIILTFLSVKIVTPNTVKTVEFL